MSEMQFPAGFQLAEAWDPFWDLRIQAEFTRFLASLFAFGEPDVDLF
jgi:hypothetical protein